MNELYFEATADTFWGCGLDIKMIEQAKQREDFHIKTNSRDTHWVQHFRVAGKSCLFT